MADRNRTPLANGCKDPLHPESVTPSLLRLATETRLEIIDLILSDPKYRSVYGIPKYEGMVWISKKFFTLFPLTQTCRKLRYESIPAFYSQFRWMVDFLMPRRYYIRWLRTLDPWALQCMKGVTLEHFTHRCPLGSLSWDGRIDVSFDCEPVKVSAGKERERSCCAAELANRELRKNLAEEFVEEIKMDRSRTKEVMMQMLMQIEDVGRKAELTTPEKRGYSSNTPRFSVKCEHSKAW